MTTKIKQLEKAGRDAVKALRKSKLSMGFPFMINRGSPFYPILS